MNKKINYTKAQFLKDVAKEARKLKRAATTTEIDNLNARTLDPRNYGSCIYGQMTGDCRSKRAAELIFGCCNRYLELPDGEDLTGADDDEKGGSFAKMKKNINGKEIEGISNATDFKESRRYSANYYSSLEAYILLPTAKNKNLIAFLRGERKDLVL